MTTNTPLVSVVLPYYNAEQTLEKAIKSILSQTFEHFELILINNNSQDKSPEIAQCISLQDSRVILATEPIQGVVYAANHGNAIAKGEFIARMDADDVSLPRRLEIQLAHFHNNTNLDISATQVEYICDTDSNTSFHHFVNWSNQVITQKQIIKNRFVEFPLVNPSLMIKSKVFQQVGQFKEGHFPEDYHWFLKALEKKCVIEKVPEILLKWNDSPSRLTRSDNRYSGEAFFNLKTEFLAKEIKKLDQFNHGIWIWGAGKLAYTRSKWLLDYEIKINGYIDIKEKKLSKYTCIHFSKINLKEQPLIISYITNRNKRDEVRAFLDSLGYQESEDYIIAG